MKTNNAYGFSEEDVQDMEKAFRSFPELKKVILHGSRAKGNYRKGSDIDLVYTGNIQTYEIRNALEDTHIPYKIDIIKYEDITSPSFQKEVNTYGKILFES